MLRFLLGLGFKQASKAKNAFSAAGKAAGAAGTATPKFNLNWAIKGQLAGTALTLALSTGPMSSRLKDAAIGNLFFWSTMGMNSGLRQAMWGVAAFAAPNVAGMVKSAAGFYRSALEARTSLAVPFAHSTAPMDQAYSSISYARSRMSEAYGSVGSNEAAIFAARYLRH